MRDDEQKSLGSLEDSFLRDMQNQCLQDSIEHIESFRNFLLELESSPRGAITSLLKECHSLKGNFAAVGFSYFADFLHGLETALNAIDKTLEGLDIDALVGINISSLEYLLSNIVTEFESYIEFLKSNPDSAQQREQRSSLLTVLSSWGPTTQLEVSSSAQDGLKPMIKSNVLKDMKNSTVEKKVEKIVSLYLLCRSANRSFAIPVKQVVEVVQNKQLTPPPCESRQLLGLMNLRGDVLPILNLSRVFGTRMQNERDFVVICEQDGSRFGFPIGHAEQIVELSHDRFQDSGTNGIISHSYVEGDKTILIVNVERALAA